METPVYHNAFVQLSQKNVQNDDFTCLHQWASNSELYFVISTVNIVSSNNNSKQTVLMRKYVYPPLLLLW